ncbi:class I SAM-dependent methyltransferase [Virgibacillus siamensis]|uniref:class I SAM-dependent methyltransferase n=1 Tax=Virgibacillus siamensis TaxID=480071 RepID=UPI0009875F66|nr:class I SAM-dependent methyltransferase [Virgibacillus siamensis]
MNNSWNKVIYKIWSPIYDRFFNSGPFPNVRKGVFKNLSAKEDKKVLIVGVGTGLDLEYVDSSKFEITAVDLSPHMLREAKSKFSRTSITFLQMDAQNLKFDDDSFDYVVGSLILSVVPNANQCFKEMTRVLKGNGQLLIFDKFVPKNKSLTFVQRLIRPIIALLGTDIGLNFDKVIQNCNEGLEVKQDVPVMLNGMYRKIIVNKLA